MQLLWFYKTMSSASQKQSEKEILNLNDQMSFINFY